MGDHEYIVALVALIVSVIALILIALQLSAQIFLTAEGQRKCSQSLLSVWSKDPTTKTHWKWRWSELRFELHFVVPEICLGTSASPIPYEPKPPKKNRSQFGAFLRTVIGARTNSDRKAESILGADRDLDYVLFLSALAYNAPDMVSWLSFLTFLRLETGDINAETIIKETFDTPLARGVAPEETCKPNLSPLEPSWPRVKYRVHSWDYMPPNAPKPFAKFTIHDIAVLVRRLGMVWKAFDPKNGDMSAEGGTHILTSSLIPGLGLVLEYRCLDDMLLAGRASQKVSSILEREQKSFTQSQKATLKKAQADGLGLAPGEFQKSDDESQRSSEINLEERDNSGRTTPNKRIWSKEMDKFVFGLVPGDPRLGLLDYPFVEVSDRLNALLPRVDRDESDLCVELSKDKYLDWQCSFNDLMAIVPPALKTGWVGIPTMTSGDDSSVFDSTLSTFGMLLKAFLYGGTKAHQSPFQSMRQNNSRLTEENFGETMLGRTGLLQGRNDGGTTQMKWVLDGVEDMMQSKVAEKMQEYHDSTTQYFIENKDEINIHELIKAFLSKAPLAAGEFRRNESRSTYISEYRGTRQLFTSPSENSKFSCILEHYFSYIPNYVEYMRTGSMCGKEDMIIEAWFTMMWRGFLSKELHYFREIEGVHVPYEYYGSRLPVYMI